MSLETSANFRRGKIQFRKIIILDALTVSGRKTPSTKEDPRDKNKWFLSRGDVYLTLSLLT